MLPVMSERLLALALAARHARMGLNIDAEEADRLDLSLDVIERVLADSGACRLERLRRRRPGLRAARRLRHRLALRAGAEARPADHGAAGQGRLLGHRDQAGAGARAHRLSRVHAQAEHRRLLHRQRPQAAVDDRPHLSAIRHAQCAHGCGDPGDGARTATASSSSACTAWARRCTRRCARPRARAAASMRRSARIPTCSPIWCAACSRTAPTRPSSTRSPMRTCRPRRSRAIRSRSWRRRGRLPTRRSRSRRRSSARARSNSQGWDITDPVTLAAIDKATRGVRRHRTAGAPRR